MAEKYQQQQQQEVQGYPLAAATVVPRSDEEYGNNYQHQSDEQMKKKKRMKCFVYIAVFAVFQVAVILVFSLTVMRIKTPKVRLGDIEVTTTNGGGDIKLNGRVLVKNTNFGHYKFDSALATVKSGNEVVGQFEIDEARARARSTKKVVFLVDLGGANVNSGTVDLVVEAKLRGKVELMKVIKKKKAADMRCTMTLVLATTTVQNLTCK